MSKKLEEDIKKRRTISNTYGGNSGYFYGSDFDAEWEEYIKNVAKTWSKPEKAVSFKENEKKDCCSNPQKYKNGMGKMLFWSCKNCGADLGDI